jgi:hypothetical protein
MEVVPRVKLLKRNDDGSVFFVWDVLSPAPTSFFFRCRWVIAVIRLQVSRKPKYESILRKKTYI